MHTTSLLALVSLVAAVAASPHPRDFHPPVMAGLFNKWRPAGEGDSRSPCPVLNTLANEGHLPHDGKGLTPASINQTLQNSLNLAPSLANFLSAPLALILHPDGTLDLGDLALHNFIEHDASLVHDDTAPGEVLAPTATNQTKVAEMVARSSGRRFLSEYDLALSRVEVEKHSPPMDAQHQGLADAEPSLVLNVFGEPDKKSEGRRLALRSFVSIFGLERFPRGWRKPKTSVEREAVDAATARIVAFKEQIKGAASGSV
ncbi:hypothetical protein AURDEDRAFT_118995 [Auricularia subglabra TFB-10046 SS5]|nr:hypothetical protein AURDEDRAFT_118995 [Auricularia subglabra TFB-10046 SS5]